MPCDSVREVTVDDRKYQLDHLVTALNSKAMTEQRGVMNARRDGDVVYFKGGNYVQTPTGGQFTFDARRAYAFSEDQRNLIRAEYAIAGMTSVAKQNGWTVNPVAKIAAAVKAVVGW